MALFSFFHLFIRSDCLKLHTGMFGNKGVPAPYTGTSNPPNIPNFKSSFDIEIDSLEDKPWRKPGANLQDWFNYGFNEETWREYCIMQRQVRGELSMPEKMANLSSKLCVLSCAVVCKCMWCLFGLSCFNCQKKKKKCFLQLRDERRLQSKIQVYESPVASAAPVQITQTPPPNAPSSSTPSSAPSSGPASLNNNSGPHPFPMHPHGPPGHMPGGPGMMPDEVSLMQKVIIYAHRLMKAGAVLLFFFLSFFSF
jgi:hypothetical protein